MITPGKEIRIISRTLAMTLSPCLTKAAVQNSTTEGLATALAGGVDHLISPLRTHTSSTKPGGWALEEHETMDQKNLTQWGH